MAALPIATALSGRWHETTADSATRVNAYVVKSDLSLFNDFTYFLNDPVNGDQFRQTDDRLIVGGSASKTYFGTVLGGTKSETTIGVQSRYDAIDVGLFNTKQRVTLSTVREDEVKEGSVGVYGALDELVPHYARPQGGCLLDRCRQRPRRQLGQRL